MDEVPRGYDALLWAKAEKALNIGFQRITEDTFIQKLEEAVASDLGDTARFIGPLMHGNYNVLFKMVIGGRVGRHVVVVKVPIPGAVRFPAEKIPIEAATATALRERTDIPVPRVWLCNSSTPDKGVGPYLVMEYINHEQTLQDAILKGQQSGLGNPDAREAKLSQDTIWKSWVPMAKCLISLSRTGYPRIGSLVQVSPNSYAVASRPLTHNMNNLVRLANVPENLLPDRNTTYATADEWYAALSDMHLARLLCQRKDVVASADNCRNKYVSRQVFRRLARQGKLSTFGFREDTWSAQSRARPASVGIPGGAAGNRGVFRLYSDDLSPSNVLVVDDDDDDGDQVIVAFVDWEFTYAAPAQFSLDPPLWLMPAKPGVWAAGVEDWARGFAEKLPLWFRAVEQAEAGEVEMKGREAGEVMLSEHMRQSWETGRFWLNYAAKRSWGFDDVYWRYLDERFFGARDEVIDEGSFWKTRVHLLSAREREAMERFVERKMREAEARTVEECEVGELSALWKEITTDDLVQTDLDY
ncbi:phosphotransferase [Xylariomycetidae sp. FL2044]|nr:phosphotransferase [Xylariomycetidae sp. FL2044]